MTVSMDAPDRRMSTHAIMAVFFIQALAGGGIFSRIPDIQAGLGIGEWVLGLALLGQPVGALLMFLFASSLIERFGTRIMLGVSVPTIALSAGLMTIAPNAALLAGAFFVYGTGFALANVTMNVEADRVEARLDTRIMNRCHGLWSMGFLGAALLGTVARGAEVSQHWHLWGLVPVIAVASLVALRLLETAPPRDHGGAARRPRFAIPTLGTMALVGFALAGVLMEVATRHWSVIYMRDSFDTAQWVETLTLPAFLVTMTAGRMLADGWTTRFGPARVAFVLTCVALVGVTMVFLAPNLWAALVGFALMGLGVCVSFPLMASAAARLGDRPASENVAAVTMTLSFVNLGTPALMGLVAEGLGIRASFALIVPFALASLLLVRWLEPDRKDEGS